MVMAEQQRRQRKREGKRRRRERDRALQRIKCRPVAASQRGGNPTEGNEKCTGQDEPGRKRNKRKKIRSKEITGLKYFDQLNPLLEQLHDVGCDRDKAGNRTFHFDQYCMLILLYLFNPICSLPPRSMICANSGLSFGHGTPPTI